MSSDEKRARRAEWPVRVFSSEDVSSTIDALEEADLQVYRDMTGIERLRVLTALINPDGERSHERSQPGLPRTP